MIHFVMLPPRKNFLRTLQILGFIAESGHCPYRYVKTPDYRDHLNKHFRIKDYKCENCGFTFMTRKALAEHSSTHEGIVYCCLICETYQIGSRQAMQMHLRNKHSDLLGKNIN